MNCTVKSHNHGNRTVNLLCGFFFVRLDISGRVTPNENIIHHPPQNRMSVVGKCLFNGQLHQFFGRISLPELHHRKTKLFQVMRHLHSPQIVKSNFFDVKFPPQFINEIFDKAIMSNITIKSFQIILLFPDILQVFLHQRLSCTYPISPFTH